jgi:hypothetical protein
MIDPGQLREFIVRPALLAINLYSPAAENLLMGTAAVESRLVYIDQLAPGNGPAYGPWQMERRTHDDLVRWLNGFPALRDKVDAMVASWPKERHYQLHTNLAYAVVMARLYYYRLKEPLPPEDNVEAMARYWKTHYNTKLGKGTVRGFVKAYKLVANG